MNETYDLGFEIQEEEVTKGGEPIKNSLEKNKENDFKEGPVEGSIKESNVDDDDNIFNIISKDILAPLGIIDEDITFEDEDQFTEAIQKKFVETVDKKVDERINSISSADEDFKELYEYLKTGGNLQTFVQTKYGADDFLYTDEDLESDEALQKYVVSEYLIRKGEVSSKEELDAELEEMESLGVLEKKATKFVKTLKSIRENEKSELIQKQKDNYNNTVNAIRKENEAILKMLDTKSEIAGMKLSKKDRESLKEYLYSKDKEGKTPRQKKISEIVQKNDIERKILGFYAEMKDYNLTEEARTKEALSLKEKLANAKTPSGGLQMTGGKRKASAADLPEEYE
jgi:hypothetical protein